MDEGFERWEDRMRQAREEAKGFPRLPGHLRKKLVAISATPNGYPCLVTLKAGGEQDWVYVAEALPWFEHWGVWPADDRAKHALPLTDVVDLRESPSRLPPSVSATLYEAGESGMGYHVFTLIFRDGTASTVVTGNAVDFPTLPEGKTPADIASVKPHEGPRSANLPRSRPYLWCLYSDG